MSEFLSIDPDTLSIKERHGYLVSAVAPRPIALATTIDKEGNVNLSPFSFFNVFSSNPPVMIFSPARRGADNTTKHTFQNVKEVSECTISIVNYPMVEQMSLSSSNYPKEVNEYHKAGFTEINSDIVKTPRVAESPVSFECKIQDIVELGDQGAAGNLVICRVVRIHIRKEFLNEDGKLDTQKLDLVARMGGSWYSRANGDLFEIPKPLSNPGIGLDQLPKQLLQSHILTANDLGRLGNVDALPTEEEIFKLKSSNEYLSLKKDYGTESEKFKEAIYHKAKDLLQLNKAKNALQLLMTIR